MADSRNRALRIGLTGGIASGKSTVAEIFTEYSVPVIDTDTVARQVVEPGQPGLDAVIERFGTGLLTSDGHLDRQSLRSLVFDDPGKRHDLEAILHPLIRTRTVEWTKRAGGPYQVIVVPLLIETGFGELVDRVLVVDCAENQQRSRLLARDDETPARIDRILAAQAGRHERLEKADDVVDNAGSLKQLRVQIAELHAKYLDLASSGSDPKGV
jgi:dephospho-CoA kinase